MKKLLLLLCIIQSASAQLNVVTDSTFSPSMNAMTKFMVILPDGYTKKHDRYPVLYLMHGLGGNYTNWVKLTNIVRYAKDHSMIIVTPDAGDGWYTNSPLQTNANYT